MPRTLAIVLLGRALFEGTARAFAFERPKRGHHRIGRLG
jgi:hypothetical protein